MSNFSTWMKCPKHSNVSDGADCVACIAIRRCLPQNALFATLKRIATATVALRLGREESEQSKLLGAILFEAATREEEPEAWEDKQHRITPLIGGSHGS